jgi:CheY-like chemotaxis protein
MKSSPSAGPTKSWHILLVDDNRQGLIVRKALLEEVGCTVQVAVSGEEGLKIFQSGTYDLVVTDYKMPGMTGAELIEKIRRLDPNVRIILLSGFVEPLGLTEESTGADIVLAKASNEATQLVRSVKRLLNGAGKRKPPGSVPPPARRSRATGR